MIDHKKMIEYIIDKQILLLKSSLYKVTFEPMCAGQKLHPEQIRNIEGFPILI